MSSPFGKLLSQAAGNTTRSRAQINSKRDNRALEAVQSSEAHTNGRLATIEDLKASSMLSKAPIGLPVCILNGLVGFDNTDMAVNVIAPPGAGKTTCLAFLMAAEWEGSAVFIDIDHQLVRGVRPYRKSLGHKDIILNAHQLYGLGSHSYNFFQPVIDAVAAGNFTKAAELARDLAFILIPEKPGNQNDNWVDKDARNDILPAAIVFKAETDPVNCNGGGLFAFLKRAAKSVLDDMGYNSESMFVMRRANKAMAEYASGAEKQIEWTVSRAAEALAIFETDSPYDLVTRRSDFDPAECKNGDHPVDIYICFDGTKLQSGGAYLSLTLASLIEQIAGASGNRHTLILADEFSQCPASKTLIKAIRAYRKRLLRVVTISQSRQATADTYGQNLQRDIEAMAGTNIWMQPEFAVARELSTKSGTQTKLTRSMSDDQTMGMSASKTISEISAPNLHIADLCFEGGMSDKQMIVDMKSLPGLLVSERYGWWEIDPYAFQLADAYLDDTNRHAPIPPRLSLEEAKALFGFAGSFSLSDINTRAQLLEGRFDAHLIAAARQLLENSL
jgi:type IV secretory pathway TraG/TraD family ATPase VirD4